MYYIFLHLGYQCLGRFKLSFFPNVAQKQDDHHLTVKVTIKSVEMDFGVNFRAPFEGRIISYV